MACPMPRADPVTSPTLSVRSTFMKPFVHILTPLTYSAPQVPEGSVDPKRSGLYNRFRAHAREKGSILTYNCYSGLSGV